MFKPYHRNDKKETKQHYLSILSEFVAGKDAVAIAKSLHMNEQSVKRDLEYVAKRVERILHKSDTQENSSSNPVVSYLGKTTCKGCGKSIDTGEYRVVWSTLELLPAKAGAVIVTAVQDEDAELDAVRGDGNCGSFCDQCATTEEFITFENPWKLRYEARLRWALAPPSSDDNYVSHVSIAGTVNDDGDHEERDPSSEQQVNLVPLVVKTNEEIRRDTLANFLKDRSSRGAMRPLMRQAVTLYVKRHTQSEIADKLKVNQSQVSRMLQGALKMAGAAL